MAAQSSQVGIVHKEVAPRPPPAREGEVVALLPVSRRTKVCGETRHSSAEGGQTWGDFRDQGAFWALALFQKPPVPQQAWVELFTCKVVLQGGEEVSDDWHAPGPPKQLLAGPTAHVGHIRVVYRKAEDPGRARVRDKE